MKCLPGRTFADLKIPCAVTAVDLNSGCEVILNDGPVKNALLATIAVPGIFPIYPWHAWELVDGGVLNPVPVSVARSLAPSLPVVAVSLHAPIGEPTRSMGMPVPAGIPKPILDRLAHIRYAQAFDVFLRSVDVGNRAIAAYRLAVDKPDVIIRPAVSDIELLEQVDVREVAGRGDRAVEDVLPELKQMVSWTSRLRRSLSRGSLMNRNLRDYARNTNIRLALGAFFLLFVIGVGLIYLIYGSGAAMLGFFCLLAALLPVVLILLFLFITDWIVKRAGRD